MSEMEVQTAAESATGLTQLQRVTNTFTAPSKTFEDINRGNRSWWLPLLIVILTGAFLYASITKEVTWSGVYQNQMRDAPAFAKRMMDNMTPEQRAIQEQKGPTNQAVTWALSPIGLLLINMAAALFLWPTINFGFGGRATFGATLAVTMYATLVLWPIKLVLGGVALLAGAAPEGFDPSNVAGTNIGFYMEQHSGVLYLLARTVDPLVIWNLVLTSIGLAIIAGTKKSSGYFAVFGWWLLIVLVFVGFAAVMG